MISEFNFSKLRKQTGQRLSSVRLQQTKISIGPILFLYYEESLVSSNLNSKLFLFHCVRPNVQCWMLNEVLDIRIWIGPHYKSESRLSSVCFAQLLALCRGIWLLSLFMLTITGRNFILINLLTLIIMKSNITMSTKKDFPYKISMSHIRFWAYIFNHVIQLF